MTIDTRVYRVPPAFYDDHVMRDCDGGTELRRTRSYVEVELDREAFDDLRSDAVYYTDRVIAEDMGFGYAGLRRSATTLIARLDEVGPPAPVPAAELARREQELADAEARTAAYLAEQAALREAEQAAHAASEAVRLDRENAIPSRILLRLENSRDPNVRVDGYPDLTQTDATRILDERDPRTKNRS